MAGPEKGREGYAADPVRDRQPQDAVEISTGTVAGIHSPPLPAPTHPPSLVTGPSVSGDHALESLSPPARGGTAGAALQHLDPASAGRRGRRPAAPAGAEPLRRRLGQPELRGRIGELVDELVPPPRRRSSRDRFASRSIRPSTVACRRQPLRSPSRRPSCTPRRDDALPQFGGRLNPDFTFANFVEGKSNQLARAAAMQVAENPGRAYNPLFIYGGVGLGKTHLMHAIGNQIRARNPDARVAYVHSEQFVGDMVRALQHNTINEFKTGLSLARCPADRRHPVFRRQGPLAGRILPYVQRAAGRPAAGGPDLRPLSEGSRWPGGAAEVALRLGTHGSHRTARARDLRGDPDEQGRSAAGVELPEEVAFFIAQRIRSNVRELEGAMRRVIANSHFTGRPITLDFAKEALRTCSRCRNAWSRSRTSRRRSRSTSRSAWRTCCRSGAAVRSRGRARSPWRLSKELTNHSLPEIGDAFGGRDHTTVLHACRVIKDCAIGDAGERGLSNLLRTLTG